MRSSSAGRKLLKIVVGIDNGHSFVRGGLFAIKSDHNRSPFYIYFNWLLLKILYMLVFGW